LQLLCKKYLEKRNILSKFPCFFYKKPSKRTYKFFFPKIATTAYNMKGCLMFWILSDLAKYSYGWLALEQHHKIVRKPTGSNSMAFH
jgi:hypothetical protein